MEIKRSNNVSFGDLAIQSLYKIPKMKRAAIINAFKTQIGDGLVHKTYNHNGQTFSQDIFIGFIPTIGKKQNPQIDKIIISTGGAFPFEQGISKETQIDFEINSQIKKIRDEFKLDDGKNYFHGYGHTLGRIRKSNDKVEICMSETDDTWFNNYRKGLNPDYKDIPNNRMNNWYIFNKNEDTFQYSKVIKENQ